MNKIEIKGEIEVIERLEKELKEKKGILDTHLKEINCYLCGNKIKENTDFYCLEIKLDRIGDWVGDPHDCYTHTLTHKIQKISEPELNFILTFSKYIKDLHDNIGDTGDFKELYKESIYVKAEEYFKKNRDFKHLEQLFETNESSIFRELSELITTFNEKTSSNIYLFESEEDEEKEGVLTSDSYIKLFKINEKDLIDFECEEDVYQQFM